MDETSSATSETENSDKSDDDVQENPEKIKRTFRCPECLLVQSFEDFNIYNVRCAAHTLQLSITDALKMSKAEVRAIKIAENLCKNFGN